MTVEETTDVAIPELRRRFEEEYADNIANGLYDTRDITRLQTDDGYAGCFIRHVMNDVTAAVSLAHTSLKWRKEMEVNDLSESSFPRWVHNLSAMYYHNTDKEGRPVLISHVAKCKKDSEKHHLQKQYIAWIFDKHFLLHPDQRVAVCFDMTGAGISNMDIELIKFQVTCFTTFYPSFLAYMLVFDMPWILNTIWRVIRTLLNEAQQKAVIFVKGEEILKYIERDQLIKSMGGTDIFEYKYLPTETSLLSIADSDSGDAALTTPDGDGPSTGHKKKVTFAQEDSTVTFVAANKSRKSRLRRQGRGSRRSSDDISRSLLLTISPSEEFVFDLKDDQKETVDVLTLFNCSDKLVAYKVKTTSPASYRVRPSSGLIKTQTSANINIVLLPGCHLAANEDRFLLMAMTVGEDITLGSPRLKELWQEKALGGDTNYMEHRLGCTVLLDDTGTDTVDGDTQDDWSLGQRMSHLSTQMNSVLQTQRELASKLRWLLISSVIILFLIFILLISAAIYWRDWSANLQRSSGHICQATSPFKLTSRV